MDLMKELTDLITIRQYIVNTTINPATSIDRPTINYMNNLLLATDKKIISLLNNEDFKEYIEYKNTKEEISNIKSGLKK